MSSWSRTVKPSADNTIPEEEIFGVDSAEMAQTNGPQHAGWVRRREIGASRVVYETLVAMKNAPVETDDNTEFPGGITTTSTTTTTSTSTTTTSTTAAPTTTTSTTAAPETTTTTTAGP